MFSILLHLICLGENSDRNPLLPGQFKLDRNLQTMAAKLICTMSAVLCAVLFFCDAFRYWSHVMMKMMRLRRPPVRWTARHFARVAVLALLNVMKCGQLSCSAIMSSLLQCHRLCDWKESSPACSSYIILQCVTKYPLYFSNNLVKNYSSALAVSRFTLWQTFSWYSPV